jgi:hypothetical protein
MNELTPLESLRVQLEALAQDWAMDASAPLTSPSGRLAFSRCSKELRLVLLQTHREPEPPTRPVASPEPLVR